MIRRETKQSSIADAFVNRSAYHNRMLEKIDRLVHWAPLRSRIESRYCLGGPGKPGFPAITLFKVLLLQQWYGLSDPQTEEAVADRLSFRSFVGLSLDEKVPDHSTIHRFRDRIAPIIDQLFAEVNRQLDGKNLILRKGTLVDATLIQAAGRPPSKATETPSDPDARWGGKGDDPTYGYKAHIGLDQDNELIRQAELTPANVHDSRQFQAMVSGDEQAVYADKGYFGLEHSIWLRNHSIRDGIMIKATRGHPLTPLQKEINRRITKVRRSIEHVFGTWKRIYQLRRCRYYSLNRNRCSLFVLCTAFNLKRTLRLQAA